MGLRSQLGPTVRSCEAIRVLVDVPRPASMRAVLARYREPVVIDESLVTPDGVALGGHHRITLERHGSIRHEGHIRATGFPLFAYSVRTTLGSSTSCSRRLRPQVGYMVPTSLEIGRRPGTRRGSKDWWSGTGRLSGRHAPKHPFNATPTHSGPSARLRPSPRRWQREPRSPGRPACASCLAFTEPMPSAWTTTSGSEASPALPQPGVSWSISGQPPLSRPLSLAPRLGPPSNSPSIIARCSHTRSTSQRGCSVRRCRWSASG